MRGRHITRSNGEEVYLIDGQEVSEAAYNAAFPDKPLDFSQGTGLIAFKPLHSDAMGVCPRHVKAAMEADRRGGVSVDYDSEGRPVYTSRGQRKRHMELHGVFDRGGGFSDAQFNGRKVEEPSSKEYDVDP